MWDLLRCNASGIDQFSRRTSTLLTVGTLSGMKTPADHANRLDWKEGRQDTIDEHGHAIAEGCLPPVPVRRGCTLQQPYILSVGANSLTRNQDLHTPQTNILLKTVEK